MNMRVVVPPPWQSITARALGCGATYGAVLGVATLVAPGLLAGVLGHDPSELGFALVFSPVAALVGALVGLACGLVGGIALAVLRRQAARSRAAARLIAGAGAALLPGAETVLLQRQGGLMPTVTIVLTAVTFGVGVARGPRIFYGKPRKLKRRAELPASDVGR